MPIMDIFDAVMDAPADQFIQHRHQHVDPFDGEPLLPRKGAVQKPLEFLHLNQPFQQSDLLIGGKKGRYPPDST